MEGAKIFEQKSRKWIYTVAALCLGAGVANAEVSLLDKNGWTLSTDGGAGGFFTQTSGDSRPGDARSLNGVVITPGGRGLAAPTAAPTTATTFDRFIEPKILENRIRTGFTPRGLGFTVGAPMVNEWKVSARMFVDAVIQADHSKGGPATITWRDAYFKMSSERWGSFTIGRALSLYHTSTYFVRL